jgi:cytochrome c5
MFNLVPKTPGSLAGWLALLLAVSACSNGSDSPAGSAPSAQAPREVQPDWRQDRLALGQATYESAGASCHDSGDQGAPVTGNRDDWEDRSDMWQAVLFNHAKAGYLEMPEKGGQPELSDESVEAAAEYMLNLTFPELPKD